ncbi:MAG: Gfo/Idh/MocA family oxidoreductase [Planctomycetaceae bacterium]|nr:Gfo/Idh/MocA family oxidoreductase [Planctomycetaceae bacterium]
MTPKIKRRDFLKLAGATTATAGGLLSAFPAPAFAQEQNLNSKLNVACIGIANRGGANVDGVKGENMVALCDIDENYLNAGKERFRNAKLFRDYRKMYDEIEKDIDAVAVSTPDHTHASASIMGMKLGKHCYCEKPLAHNVKEIRDMMAVAREKRLATQMGTQIHAEDNYRRVVELVRAGAIGTIREVHVWCGSRWGGRGFSTETPEVPANIDWDLWLGPAEVRPYHPQYFGGAWRGFWAFGNGTLGDMACHHIDLSFWALGLRLPTTVEAFCESEPTKEVAPADLRVEYTFAESTRSFGGTTRTRPAIKLTWYDGNLRPALIKEKGLPEWGAGTLFVGEEGLLMADYGQRKLYPEDKFADYKAPEKTIPDSVGHHQEWINACKTGSRTTCNFGYSGPLAETVLLGAVAFRTGKKLEWDAANMKATNCPEADQYLSRTYRKGWEV